MQQIPSRRQLKISELLKKGLSEIFSGRRHFDPLLESQNLTIVNVVVNTDLKIAKISVDSYVSSKDEKMIAMIIKVLNDNSGFYRSMLAKSLKLRFTPQLRFEAQK